MRFTTTLAGVATVACAIKIEQATVTESDPTSFDASITLHCYDCVVVTSSEEPAQGSTDGEPVVEPAG